MIFSGFSLAYIFDLNRQNKEIIDLDYFFNNFAKTGPLKIIDKIKYQFSLFNTELN